MSAIEIAGIVLAAIVAYTALSFLIACAIGMRIRHVRELEDRMRQPWWLQ